MRGKSKKEKKKKKRLSSDSDFHSFSFIFIHWVHRERSLALIVESFPPLFCFRTTNPRSFPAKMIVTRTFLVPVDDSEVKDEEREEKGEKKEICFQCFLINDRDTSPISQPRPSLFFPPFCSFRFLQQLLSSSLFLRPLFIASTGLDQGRQVDSGAARAPR